MMCENTEDREHERVLGPTRSRRATHGNQMHHDADCEECGAPYWRHDGTNWQMKRGTGDDCDCDSV